MQLPREPLLNPTPILELRPTQITVGMNEVRLKQAAWRSQHGEKPAQFLGQHMIPAVLGPKRRHYITDHHHLALALHNEGVESVLVTVTADLSRLDEQAFWFFLDNTGLTHPYDADGVRQDYQDIPKNVKHLADDPYRSLAGELRRVGGYAKETVPFSEFLWADFLRRRIRRKLIARDFSKAAAAALVLAKEQEASYLPGWCGPADNGG